MKKILLVILGLVIAGVVGFIGAEFAYKAPAAEVRSGGTSNLSNLVVQSLVQSGGANSTTTGAASILAASDLTPYSLVVLTPSIFGSQVTLPATSTLSTASTSAGVNGPFLPNSGDSSTIYFYNSTSTTATTTLLGGTGWKMSIATSTATSTATLNPSKGASLEMTRLPTGDIMGFITFGI